MTETNQDDANRILDRDKLIKLLELVHPEMAKRLTRQTESIIVDAKTIALIYKNAFEPKNDPDFSWMLRHWCDLLLILEHNFNKKFKVYLFSYNPSMEYNLSLSEERKIYKIDQNIPGRMSRKKITDIQIGAHPYPFVVMKYFPLSSIVKENTYCVQSYDKKYVFEMEKSSYIDKKFNVVESNLPYGGPARTILNGIFSIAKITNSPVVFLGKNKNDTCKILNFDTKGSGGKKPLEKLFDLGFSHLKLHKMVGNVSKSYMVFEKFFPWWQKREFYEGRSGSYIIINREFFDEFLLPGAVPSDFNSYLSMKRCPLAMDIYVWLNFRMNKFPNNSTEINMQIKDLMDQFGTKNSDDHYDIHSFKKSLIRAFENYLYKIWPELKSEEALVFGVEDGDHYLKIKKIDPHVKPLV